MFKNLAIALGLMAGLAACVGPYGYNGYNGYNGYGGAGYGYGQPASYYGRGYDPNYPRTSQHGTMQW